MKKYILILLLFTGFLQAQTYPVNPTKFGKISLNTNTEASTATKLNVQETDGQINWLQPINLPIPYTSVNYSSPTQTIGNHLAGIDTRLGQISSTSAGVTQRVYFTADNTTVTAGTFYTSSITGKGTAPAPSPAFALVLADNTKGYFNKDLISIAQPSPTIGYAGTYSGNLTVSATPTPVATQQRFTIEIYRTDNGGNPIASGVSGAPVGDLGVTVLAILDSGIINLTAGAITNIAVSGVLTQNITLNTGERLRYHVSASKIGTGGGNVTFGVYYGTSYNSYYDVPVAITTDAVLNKSAVAGAITDTDALNTLNGGLVYKRTIAQIRALTGALPSNNFYTTDLGQEGNWYYDSTDTTTADNTGTVLVTADGKRIKRIYSNILFTEWFGAVGNGIANDGTAIQNTINASVYGNEIQFYTNKTYLSSALTLKSGVSLKGGSVSGIDHTVTNPKLIYSGTTGDFLTLVFGASSPYSPAKGLKISNLTIDGNNTTGALIKLSTFRSLIENCNLSNASKIIYYPNTTGWIGENRIKGNNIFSFTDAIYSEGTFGLDGHIEDNFIFNGTRGIFLADASGWDISTNHLYGITGVNIEVSGALYSIRANYLDNIDTTGIKATISSAVSGTLIQNNIVSNLSSNNTIGIDIIANSTGKVLISGNSIYAVTSLTNTTGIRTTGSATFFGSVINNLLDQLDNNYVLHSSTNTDFTEVRNNRLLMNGNEIRFEHNGLTTWRNSLMAQSVLPETVYSANSGSLGINSAGGIGTLWLKTTGTGNTGWEQVFSGKATSSKTGAITLSGDLSGTADVPLVTKISSSLVNSSTGYEILTRNTTTGIIEKQTNTFFAPNVLTGYVSGAGTVSATDTVLQAIQKLNGNQVALGITSASYTPTVTASTNVTSATLGTASYTKNGNIVTGVISINMQATAINSLSEITFTAPVNRAAVVPNYYVGNGTYQTDSAFGAGNTFFSGSSANTITLRFNSGGSVASSGNCVFTFQYDVTK